MTFRVTLAILSLLLLTGCDEKAVPVDNDSNLSKPNPVHPKGYIETH